MENKAKAIPTPLPIGLEFFDTMIERGYYYVDKTLLIRDILNKDAMFTLCTRPRRFGKTLNQTMLKCFFEDTAPVGGKDMRPLFNGLKIESAGEEYMKHQGKYPVIFLSFKDVKDDSYKETYTSLKYAIADEFKRHKYLLEKLTDSDDAELFKKIKSGKAALSEYKRSLKFLSKCLEDYYGEKTVILIDEYDVPLENAWSCGFYEKMVSVIRSLMSGALKGNPHLQFAVITGCLRISKESIFTGLNNLEVISILDKRYSEHFGFTQAEMDAMLEHYGLTGKRETVRDWYNGYLFGDSTVYNPWSSIKVVSAWLDYINELPKPHWANTSGNDIVQKLLENSTADVKADLETLMAGGVISKKIHEDITYNEIEDDAENIWNFLFFTGYLKKIGHERQDENNRLILDLSIPNREVKYIYFTKIQKWFNEKIKERDYNQFFSALLNGDAGTVQKELNETLWDTVSYFDGKEDFYHGMMVGILGRLEYYTVKSNRETGLGRCDIVIKQAIRRDKAILIELKFADDDKNLKEECDDALKQIEVRKYEQELKSEHYTEILKYGIAFCGKYCEVKIGRDELAGH